MAHYAKVTNGVVLKIIVADEQFFETFVDDEPGEWIQTSYNTRGGVHYDPVTNEPDDGTPLRKNYAGIGYTYDSERDAFIAPKPYESWVLDEASCQWEPPIEHPSEGWYHWGEDAYQADTNSPKTAGWVESVQ